MTTNLSWLLTVPASTTQEHVPLSADLAEAPLLEILVAAGHPGYCCRRTSTGDAVADLLTRLPPSPDITPETYAQVWRYAQRADGARSMNESEEALLTDLERAEARVAALVEEVGRLTAERAALLAPVEGVDLEEVLRLDREGTAEPWVVEMDSDGDEFTTWEWPWRIKGVVNFAEEGDNRNDPTLIAAYRTAAPALARSLMAERAHVREVEASEKRLMAEAEELRLTLAAEQGKPEGAPSEGWRWTGVVWFHPASRMVVEPVGRLWRLNPDVNDVRYARLSSLDPMPARAAMLAADAATEAR